MWQTHTHAGLITGHNMCTRDRPITNNNGETFDQPIGTNFQKYNVRV